MDRGAREEYCCIHAALASIPPHERSLILPEDHTVVSTGCRYVLWVMNSGRVRIEDRRRRA
jgi:hypothetical protein